MSGDRFGKNFDRLFAAVITPYKDNYEVDESALRRLLRHFMEPKFRDAGSGIVINPMAGEVLFLDRKEKRRNVEIAVEECGGKVPIFAGASALRTEEAIKVAVDAKEVGADGLFLTPPVGLADIAHLWESDKYPEVWLDVVKAQLKVADLPVITHPSGGYPTVFSPGLSLGVTLKICKEIPNIVGWKIIYGYDSSITIARGLRGLDRHVAILHAQCKRFHEYLATRYFDGTVSGAFNYAMDPMMDHITAWKRRDLNEACRIWESGLSDLQEYVSSLRLHVRYKTATWLRGTIPFPFMRPPGPKPTKEELLTLRRLLIAAGLDVIPEEEVNRLIRTFDLL